MLQLLHVKVHCASAACALCKCNSSLAHALLQQQPCTVRGQQQIVQHCAAAACSDWWSRRSFLRGLHPHTRPHSTLNYNSTIIQIHLALYTNTFCSLDKYIWQFWQIHLVHLQCTPTHTLHCLSMHQPDRKEERWGVGSGLQLIGKCTTVEKSCTVKSANVQY